MRSTGSGPMGALLMLAPLVAVPIFAVVGIPQFAPGNLIDINGPKSAATSREHRSPAESRLGDAARHEADDLFAPLEESSAEVDGFDDPLASRRSAPAGRRTGRDVDQLAEESPRPRGRQASPFEENSDEEFAENSADDLNNGDTEEVTPRTRQRPQAKKKSTNEFEDVANAAEPFNEFDDTSNANTQPRGQRYADASSGFEGDASNRRVNPGRGPETQLPPRQANPAENAEEANPFEAPPVQNKSRPPLQKKTSPPTLPRDAHDAPVFQPETSAAENEVADAASFAPPPASKAANTGRRSPPAVIPPKAPEIAEEPEAAPATADQESVAGVDELTWQVATKRLRALGVAKSKQYFTYLEDSDSFLFTCSAVHAKDPKKTVRLEAEADDPLLAVSQVLEKLEAWQAGSPQRRVAVRGQE